MNTKKEIREHIKILLKNVNREAESLKVSEHLNQILPAEGLVLGYEPLKDEPDLTSLIDELKQEERLVLIRGDYSDPDLSFPHPDSEPDQIVMAIVPGRAFDRNGNRIGRGGGTFDRILEKLSCRKVGVSFTCQILEQIPHESHDQKMDCVIDPDGCVCAEKHSL
ncbi:MAG: hypothetical protein JKX97_08195 [Candidatus Lindowbacteria bacterium]|nr:hypothetical protein [Candidatus Lindowbacteria bacterium]